MEKFGKSQPVKRVEDVRFLTGAGRYVDDITPDGALRGYVFRAPVAHAQIDSLDVTEARGVAGVHLVLTAKDLIQHGFTQGLWGTTVPNRDGSKGASPFRPVLAAPVDGREAAQLLHLQHRAGVAALQKDLRTGFQGLLFRGYSLLFGFIQQPDQVETNKRISSKFIE